MESRTEKLAQKLDATWNNLDNARKRAIAEKERFTKSVSKLLPADTSLVVFGSLARDEYTSGSDIDWTLLVDGRASSNHLDVAFNIESKIKELERKQPGPEGTFGGLAFSHDIIHNIGGNDDTNKNTTRRILLLLESTSIGRYDAYNRVKREVITRYVVEDWGWMNNKVSVPRFLLNDIVRYWRTLAVDFGYKRRQRQGRGWALRTIKLRMSRKLIYASGLIACFSCKTNSNLNQQMATATSPEEKNEIVINHLMNIMSMSPLDNLANLILDNEQLHVAATEIFESYDKFIGLLEDSDTRKKLDKLAPENAAEDQSYKMARNISHTFQDGLNKLFLASNGTELFELTKKYGVF